jgi:hypothetical protein
MRDLKVLNSKTFRKWVKLIVLSFVSKFQISLIYMLSDVH